MFAPCGRALIKTTKKSDKSLKSNGRTGQSVHANHGLPGRGATQWLYLDKCVDDADEGRQAVTYLLSDSSAHT